MAANPRPSDSKPVYGGTTESRRVRVSDYRGIYEIHPDHILVVRVGNRRDIYRRWHPA